jgi:hypothetical protein
VNDESDDELVRAIDYHCPVERKVSVRSARREIGAKRPSRDWPSDGTGEWKELREVKDPRHPAAESCETKLLGMSDARDEEEHNGECETLPELSCHSALLQQFRVHGRVPQQTPGLFTETALANASF